MAACHLAEEEMVLRSRPLPDCYFRAPTRVLSIFLGVARIALAAGTIHVAIESVKQDNFAGDRKYRFITFYWTEALVNY